jgi:glycolate oxidase FAD binding subunit
MVGIEQASGSDMDAPSVEPAGGRYNVPWASGHLLAAQPRSIEEVSKVLQWANERGLKVVPWGSGSKQDRGAPPTSCDIILDMSRIVGVIEHAAGDMTVTVWAGTPVAELQRDLAKAGQFLAIDAPVQGTVGGLIATGDSGPRRLRYGGVRDMLLGVVFVRADGTVARAGGKVVKNVAGYDLPKLLTGSLGTLGVVVEATFRLYPIPRASTTAVSRGRTVTEAVQVGKRLLASGVVPTIVDYYAESGQGTLAVRFETSPRAAEGQAERALSLLGAAEKVEGEAEAELWRRFDGTTSTQEDDVLARLITTPAGLPSLLETAYKRARESNLELAVRAHLYGHALIRLTKPDRGAAIDLLRYIRQQAESCGSNLVIWRAPGEIRQQIAVWGDPDEGLPLMRQVKAQFDPKATLNPGRFVGGI